LKRGNAYSAFKLRVVFVYKKFLLNKRDSAMIGKEKIKDITISEKERQLQ